MGRLAAKALSTSLSASFLQWVKVMKFGRRVRDNPYVEGNLEANQASSFLMHAVNGIATASITQDLPELYEHIVKLALDLTDAHHGFLFLVDQADGSLHLKHAFEKEIVNEVRQRHHT